VARLAGLPAAVIERARAVLAKLESTGQGERARSVLADLPLFQTVHEKRELAPSGPTHEDGGAGTAASRMLAEVRPDDLSPREALDLIYRLKAIIDGDEPDEGMPKDHLE